jgi:hypothetical protein
VVHGVGTRCGDSRREVIRFGRALDVAGAAPATVRIAALDRDERAPGIDLGDLDPEAFGVRYVPTFVVPRAGPNGVMREVGRIVEEAREGVESVPGRVLRAERTATVTSRGRS